MPKLETHVTPVELVDGYRQSYSFRPRRAVVMVYDQTLIFGATVHACGPKQTLLQGLTVRIQDQDCHLVLLTRDRILS